MKVLVVEDDTMLAGVIDRNLRARGHESRHADSGAEALRLVALERPQALVLDVNLPDSSAWEVLRNIDADNRQSMRVIVVSAAPISQKRLHEFRPQGHLQKPFAIGSLMHLIEQDAREAEEALGADERTVF